MENKTGKYFKYAIGEIVLVVIGILIALQINNWNESRKKKKQLDVIYTSIEQNLKTDLKTINSANTEMRAFCFTAGITIVNKMLLKYSIHFLYE